jgi:hypothetical protein
VYGNQVFENLENQDFENHENQVFQRPENIEKHVFQGQIHFRTEGLGGGKAIINTRPWH